MGTEPASAGWAPAPRQTQQSSAPPGPPPPSGTQKREKTESKNADEGIEFLIRWIGGNARVSIISPLYMRYRYKGNKIEHSHLFLKEKRKNQPKSPNRKSAPKGENEKSKKRKNPKTPIHLGPRSRRCVCDIHKISRTAAQWGPVTMNGRGEGTKIQPFRKLVSEERIGKGRVNFSRLAE